MCSKTPKNVSLSTTESADYRFAATSLQKNVGKGYRERCYQVLKILYSNKLKAHSLISEDIYLKRKQSVRKPALKKKKMAK